MEAARERERDGTVARRGWVRQEIPPPPPAQSLALFWWPLSPVGDLAIRELDTVKAAAL